MARTGENPLIFHLETLPRTAKKALDFLAGQAWLKRGNWYLAGGTALALQVGHRQSVDLDFFNHSADFSEGRLVGHFKNNIWSTGFIKEGTIYGKLLGAKISFIAYPFFIPKQKLLPYGRVSILHAGDIAVMKIIAISQRGKKRDFVDLYWYTNNREPLEDVISRIFDQYADIDHNLHHILRSLTYFEDAEKDPMPRLNFAVTWPEIKAYFRREVPRLARKLLQLDA